MLHKPSESFYTRHPVFYLANEVKAIATPLFDATKATYFDYCRYYPDHTFVGVSSDAAWTEHYFRRQFHMSTTLKNNGVHLWQSFQPESVLSEAKEYFNYDHGISIINNKQDYIEYFGIATTSDNKSILSLYFNHLDQIKKICHYLAEQSQSLILKSPFPPIVVPTSMQGKLIADPMVDVKNINLNHPRAHLIQLLTKQEQEAINYLMLGLTAKEIANKMALSVRTIEKYLDKAKIKLGCSGRSSLIKLYFEVFGSSWFDHILNRL